MAYMAELPVSANKIELCGVYDSWEMANFSYSCCRGLHVHAGQQHGEYRSAICYA